MHARWLVLSLSMLVLAACTRDGEGDVYTGTFARCLCRADLSGLVDLEQSRSRLAIRLFEDETAQLAGEVILDGEVEIVGSDIEDEGNDPYPIQDLKLQGRSLEGKIDIPDFLLTPRFQGEFQDDFRLLLITVRRLGEITLVRLDAEPSEVPDTADTGATSE